MKRGQIYENNFSGEPAEGREFPVAQDRLLIANNREPCLPSAVCSLPFAFSV